MKTLLILLLSAISGILYRLGGSVQTKLRDMGCPTVAILAVWLLHGVHGNYWWAYLLSWGAMFGACTTYWKKKEDPARWWNWMLHGTVIGIALMPMAFAGIAWWAILIRAVALGGLMTLVSELSSNVWVEECGRGALIILTMPLTLL